MFQLGHERSPLEPPGSERRAIDRPVHLGSGDREQLFELADCVLTTPVTADEVRFLSGAQLGLPAAELASAQATFMIRPLRC